MSDNAIEIRGLEKRFPKFKLGPLDLTVPRGAIYGLIGPNGAGKTTTLDLMFGLGENDAGQIRVLGFDHKKDDVAFKRRVAYAGPEFNYAAWGKVAGAIRFVRGFFPDWDHDYCARLLKAFDLDADEPIKTLSFGARTKLSLLLALARRPEVLVMDEPTTGLDAVSKQRVFSELLAQVEERECTVLISSHGLADLERYTDHIGMIKEGKLLLEGRTDEIVERFQMVDFEAPEGMNLRTIEGLTLVRQDGKRCRALLDIRNGSAERLASAGGIELAAASVTLEELFVALVGEEEAS